MASSSGSRRFDVFPSFSGEDVRRGFLSYLLKEFDRKSINSFIDHGIERSRPIGPELVSAIREARISVVIFSKNYASSTWCLNELVEIHKCSMELDQMVIPVFYYVDPSDVRKQTGEFGKVFEETCKGKQEDHIQRWIQALTDVANMAGEDIHNGPNEAHMVEKIANDVLNKLISPPSGFGDFVGIEDHLEAMNSIMCLESEEVRMVGIWGQSGIGKSTLGRALFSHLSPKFSHRNFSTYKCTDQDASGKKLSWEQNFLSEILGQKDLKIENCGVVKERLKYKKVLIVLDDVDSLEFLKTLVGKTEWFGPGSRIIVITQDRHLLKAHKIDLVYEVKIPDEDLALKMLCQSAFGEKYPPDDFKELVVEVAKLTGNLPLGLSVLGSSLSERTKKEWTELLPELQNGLSRDIMKTLRVGYDRLDKKDQELFLYIAYLFNNKSVKFINEFFGDVNAGLKRLAEKSLIRITSNRKMVEMQNLLKSIIPKEELATILQENVKSLIPENEIVEMHNLLEKLGREIDGEESRGNPGKRRFLTDAEEILDVFTDQIGTETVLGIFFNTSSPSQIEKSFISIDGKSFEGMFNLQFLKIHMPFCEPQPSQNYFWQDSYLYPPHPQLVPQSIEKNLCLWPLCKPQLHLPNGVVYLPQEPYFWEVSSRNRPHGQLVPQSTEKNLCLWPQCKPQLRLPNGLVYLSRKLKWLEWNHCPLKCLPCNFKAEFLTELRMENSKLEKLWEGIQQLRSLRTMTMRGSYYLKEIPDLSKAINLERVDFSYCGNLESFPSPLNSESLVYLNLMDCPSLKNFPQILMDSIRHRIEIKVDNCLWNMNLPGVDYLDCLRKCNPIKFRSEHIVCLIVNGSTLEKLWGGVQSLGSLSEMDLSSYENLKEIPDLSKATNLRYLQLYGCISLVALPFTIGSLEKLEILEMGYCTGLEVLPGDVNLSSLKNLSLNGCSSLTSFPQISRSIEYLHLDDTAIEEVPCCIEMLHVLIKLSMCGCNKLKTISSNIFRLKNLKQVDFKDCGGVITMLNDATRVATIEDPYENIEKRNKDEKRRTRDRVKYSHGYFNFQNCLKLDRDARELIMQSCFKSTMVLPGAEVPAYFKHRAYGNSLTVTLPQSSLSHQFLRFNVCAVVESQARSSSGLYLRFCFRGQVYSHCVAKVKPLICETDHLVLSSFKIRPTGLPSNLSSMEVKFEFEELTRIKEFGLRLLYVSPSPNDRDSSSKTDYNQKSGEKFEVVETQSSKKQMHMTSGKFKEYFNAPCGQIVTDTRVMAPNPELGEFSSSVSSYPYLEEESLCVDSIITEQQDAQIPIVDANLFYRRRALVYDEFQLIPIVDEFIGFSLLDEEMKHEKEWIICRTVNWEDNWTWT